MVSSRDFGATLGTCGLRNIQSGWLPPRQFKRKLPVVRRMARKAAIVEIFGQLPNLSG